MDVYTFFFLFFFDNIHIFTVSRETDQIILFLVAGAQNSQFGIDSGKIHSGIPFHIDTAFFFISMSTVEL